MFWQRLLVISVLSVSTLSNADISDHKVCLKESDSGSCQQYKLPFHEDNTINDYIIALKRELSKKAVSKAMRLSEQATNLMELNTLRETLMKHEESGQFKREQLYLKKNF